MTHPPSESVTHHLKTFTHICVKIMTHHFMKMTDPWRTSFCAHRNDGPIDEPCDTLTVKWLTKTHIWVSVVTNLLLPWRYYMYASSIWQYMTHHSRGSRGASYKWHLHYRVYVAVSRLCLALSEKITTLTGQTYMKVWPWHYFHEESTCISLNIHINKPVHWL